MFPHYMKFCLTSNIMCPIFAWKWNDIWTSTWSRALVFLKKMIYLRVNPYKGKFCWSGSIFRKRHWSRLNRLRWIIFWTLPPSAMWETICDSCTRNSSVTYVLICVQTYWLGKLHVPFDVQLICVQSTYHSFCIVHKTVSFVSISKTRI